jgi:dienelactone hydrolase
LPLLLLQIKTILDDKRSKTGLDASITYYPNMPHGYSLRGADAANSASATAAFSAGAAFFKKHLNSK